MPAAPGGPVSRYVDDRRVRRAARCQVGVALALGLLSASGARADSNDLQIYRLGSTSDPSAVTRLRLLGDELGVAISSTTLAPANTVGIDGFDFGFQTSFVFINSGASVGGQPYWVTEQLPPSVLVVPQLHFRKGLPYSFEVGGSLSTIANSHLFAGAAEVKWGILEGFRYAPDLSARFSVSRLFGQNDFDLTSGVLDFTLGKEFGIAGLFSLAPYLGYALTGIDTSSRVFWGAPTSTTQNQYLQNPVANQQIFPEQGISKNFYDRFYAGVRLLSYVVSLDLEYGYSHPSAFNAGGFPTSDGLSTLAAKLALTF